MKKISLVFLLLGLTVSTLLNQLSAQKVSIASCKSALGEFKHDGNFNSTVLGANESAEMYKTFFSGMTYRMVLCKPDALKAIHVRVIDGDGRVLFDNKDHNYQLVWDFSVRSTQMLVIQMKGIGGALTSSQKANVSVIFGIDNES
jgi:hypothetical protein